MKNELTLLAIILFATSFNLAGYSYSGLSDEEKIDATFSAADFFADACESTKVAEENQENLQPEILLYSNQENDKVGFILNNTKGFTSFDYQIVTTHTNDLGTKQEAVIGKIHNPEDLSIIQNEWVELGTCSSGICTYYKNVSQVELNVDFIKEENIVTTLSDTLTF